MFSGTNPSGLEFEVIDGDGDVLGSFHAHAEALACGRAVPWYAGDCRIRRDPAVVARLHAETMAHQANRIRQFNNDFNS